MSLSKTSFGIGPNVLSNVIETENFDMPVPKEFIQIDPSMDRLRGVIIPANKQYIGINKGGIITPYTGGWRTIKKSNPGGIYGGEGVWCGHSFGIYGV